MKTEADLVNLIPRRETPFLPGVVVRCVGISLSKLNSWRTPRGATNAAPLSPDLGFTGRFYTFDQMLIVAIAKYLSEPGIGPSNMEDVTFALIKEMNIWYDQNSRSNQAASRSFYETHAILHCRYHPDLKPDGFAAEIGSRFGGGWSGLDEPFEAEFDWRTESGLNLIIPLRPLIAELVQKLEADKARNK